MFDGFAGALKKLFNMLPTVDFQGFIDYLTGDLADYLGYINWVIPFGTILKIEFVWLTCVGTYYVYTLAKPLIVKFLKTLL